MANINRNIRYYQPNDPYYWEVDNLPLTDLLGNDVILETRINALEEFLGGLGGGGDSKGSVSLASITDLKAWSEPVSGTATDFGKVFVRPGKFLSRMQLPATRESGWRMMRDRSVVFNNEKFGSSQDDMLNTTTLTPFVRESQGLARTAVVEFYSNIDGTDKSIPIESFDADDFNGGSAPYERLDLIYIKGSKALDTDGDATTTPPEYLQAALPNAELGVIKGAYFRTDAAGGLHTNGTRFLNPLARINGRTTGMGMQDLPPTTNLPGFGTVPMPDDLNNFAWHTVSPRDPSSLASMQVETQACFTVPVAYVRVPSNYTEGDPISPENIIDIRPFFRTTELTGSERQAVASSWDPHGNNPFVTQNHFLSYYTPLESRVTVNENDIAANSGSITINTSRIINLEEDTSALQLSVSGTGTSVTTSSLNHEGRITSLETAAGQGGPQILVERHKFFAEPIAVTGPVTTNDLGSAASPKTWTISGFPASHAPNVVAVQFNLQSGFVGNDTDSINYVYIKGGGQNFHLIGTWGVAQSNGDIRRNSGMVNTFYGEVDIIPASGGAATLEFHTYANGSADVTHYITVTGYIVAENA